MSTPNNMNPPATGGAARRQPRESTTPQATPSRSPSRLASKNATISTPNMTRTQSTRKTGTGTPVSARAAVKRLSTTTNVRNGSDDGGGADDDGRAQTAAAVEELQERLKQAENATEDFQKQNDILQTRLDDAMNDQAKLEDDFNELNERVEELDTQNKESLRQKRELEGIYEADRANAIKEREAALSREEELQESIQGLRESIAQRGLRVGLEEERRPGISRSSSFRSNSSPTLESGQFAPSSSIQRSDSRSSSRLVLQKDKIIESLRLELAEVQIKMVEMENMGGGRMQELERTLMETKVTNARLMEDNESYQLLLSEKTLTGNLGSGELIRPVSPSDCTGQKGLSSLADELGDGSEVEDENYKKFHTEIASLKDQNKALQTYINNIISKLLEHSEFESILHNNPNIMSVPKPTEKTLPPPPRRESESTTDSSLLVRTRTKLTGGSRPRPRPTSQIMSRSDSAAIPTVRENLTTAPSIPVARPQLRSGSGGHGRGNSEWNTTVVAVNANLGQSPNLSGQLSPPLISPRHSFSLAPNQRLSTTRTTSGGSIPTINEGEKSEHRPQRDSKISSGRNSVASDRSEHSSPPHSTMSGAERGGAVMTGRGPRPLRLVQSAADEEAEKKRNNRNSWYGWFNKASTDKTGS